MSNRLFPSTAWAWPSGGLDQLLHAALSPDRAAALDGFRRWLAEHDIDEVAFREHRLLAAIASRHGEAVSGHPAHPRLVGLQRQLWTRSRMALAEALPILREMHGKGIPVMLLKGGARIAARPGDQQSRVAHDLDILVDRPHFAAALDVLLAAGWVPASGESPLALVARAHSLRAMNLFRGRFGDIDIHQWAYGRASPILPANDVLWAEALPAELMGCPVLVPSATDRLALAIHHSALDAHTHSDWLVDCAQLVAAGEVEWSRLHCLLCELGAIVPAQVVFSYLSGGIGLPVPADFLRAILGDSRAGTLGRISELLQAKPRANWNLPTRLARGIAKQLRLRRENRGAFKPTVIRGTVSRMGKRACPEPFFQRVLLSGRPGFGPATKPFCIELAVDLPLVGRRIEFELNTDTRHLVRLRARSLWLRPGRAVLRFAGVLRDLGEHERLWIEARPGCALRGGESEEELARYAPVPFAVLPATKRARGGA